MKTLIAGLNNYLARNISVCFAEEGHQVTCLVRSRRLFYKHVPEKYGVHVVEDDLFSRTSPLKLEQDIQVAFYFNQSPVNEMNIRVEMELIALQKYVRALKGTDCRHLIYVTKLADDNSDRIISFLRECGLDHTVVRISNIIGKGSALMNILSKLAKQKLVIVPKEFATTQCQPIHLLDVCTYLNKIMLDTATYGQIFDVGGPEAMTYKQAFDRFLDISKLKKKVLGLPELGKPISTFLGRYVYHLEHDLAASFSVYMNKNLIPVHNGLATLYPMELATVEASIRDALEG